MHGASLANARRKIQARKVMLSARNKYSVFKTQCLAYLTLIEKEDLTKGYPLSMQPDLPVKNCVLSDAPSHEIRQSNNNSLYNENGMLGIRPG